MSGGKWDKALRELAHELTILHSPIADREQAMEAVLRERLEPLLELCELRDELLACYRLQKHPSDALLDRLKELRVLEAKWRS